MTSDWASLQRRARLDLPLPALMVFAALAVLAIVFTVFYSAFLLTPFDLRVRRVTGEITDVSYFTCKNGRSTRRSKCSTGFRVQVRGFNGAVVIADAPPTGTSDGGLIVGRQFDGLVRPFGTPHAYAVAVDGRVIVAPRPNYQPRDLTIIYLIAAYFALVGGKYITALFSRLRLRRRIMAIGSPSPS